MKPFPIKPGKPNQNANVESFNGCFRDECLNRHWFTSLLQAKAVIDMWRREYSEEQPKKDIERIAPRGPCMQPAIKTATVILGF